MAEAAKLCDRVAIIHAGHLVTIGAVPELLTQTSTTDLEDAFMALIGAGPALSAKEAVYA